MTATSTKANEGRASTRHYKSQPLLLGAAFAAYGVLSDLSYHPCFRWHRKRSHQANKAIDDLATAINTYGKESGQHRHRPRRSRQGHRGHPLPSRDEDPEGEVEALAGGDAAARIAAGVVPRRTNIAIITSGLVLFDCENPEEADRVLEHCGETSHKLRSPGGGLHLGYRKRKGVALSNQVKIKGLPIDIRTDGGLEMIPNSETRTAL